MNELEKWQPDTLLPGMWPTMVDSSRIGGNSTLTAPIPSIGTFTLGALADSTYEYLPKQYMLLGGRSKAYKSMYENFIDVAKEYLFFRPMTVDERDILISGAVAVNRGEKPSLIPELQHLTCFAGGMLAIAGKIFSRADDVEAGRKLTDGCIWAYENTPTGIMPETILAVPCKNKTSCRWSTEAWWDSIEPGANEIRMRQMIRDQRLTPGFAGIQDGRYLLR
jgi:mannosyl-oligosaccharide alpha-1,2-mannosidase